jgi:hypothetical protein
VDSPDLRRARWHKSSYSANGSTCVEVAANLPGIVLVRDSTNPQGLRLTLSHPAWSDFTQQIKHGEFGI